MESFEASESVANTGTGARREGEGFEKLISQFWGVLREDMVKARAKSRGCLQVGSRQWDQLCVDRRTLYIPQSCRDGAHEAGSPEDRWLQLAFQVDDLVAAYPTVQEAVRRYAPASGPYAGPLYPGMFTGLSTRFDDTVVLEENGVLREKVLLE